MVHAKGAQLPRAAPDRKAAVLRVEPVVATPVADPGVWVHVAVAVLDQDLVVVLTIEEVDTLCAHSLPLREAVNCLKYLNCPRCLSCGRVCRWGRCKRSRLCCLYPSPCRNTKQALDSRGEATPKCSHTYPTAHPGHLPAVALRAKHAPPLEILPSSSLSSIAKSAASCCGVSLPSLGHSSLSRDSDSDEVLLEGTG